jgi:hypothetical protein
LKLNGASIAQASSLSPPGAPDTPSPPTTVLSVVRNTSPAGTNRTSGAVLRAPFSGPVSLPAMSSPIVFLKFLPKKNAVYAFR